jgi:hypothetical protein
MNIENMSREQLQAEIARLQEQVKATLALKISEKGAVSLYGMGRFPVTLYSQQWVKVLDNADEIRAFINANRAKLSVKQPKQ